MIAKNLTIEQILKFLSIVDNTFIIPLSHKQSLCNLAQKFLDCGTLCVIIKNNKIISMIAGYIKNTINNMAYISVVATIPEAQGKGYATIILKEFIEIVRSCGLKGVHLYTDARNINAISMYERLGFIEYLIENDERPTDKHLVYWIK